MPIDDDHDVELDSFEWHQRKDVINAAKHGIDFLDALKVFSDPSVVIIDSAGAHREHRQLAVGLVDGLLVTVVFTVRGQRIRLISARRAGISERKRYGN